MTRLAVVVLCACICRMVVASETDHTVDFSQDIAPILINRCLSCHADQALGGLRLTQRELLLQGGDSGPVISPGNSEKSLLVQLVSLPKDDGGKMPPEGSRLTSEQISKLRQWIDLGAKWPEGLALKSPRQAALDHWSFQPICCPPLPSVRQPERALQGLDFFIQQKLDGEQIEPSPPADRRTVLRRVTLDLLGLPPTPDEVHKYVADEHPEAYERQLDRLFASPQYGERWARPWLDLCHFADTDGYLTDQLRPVAWRYRQWLIEALNRDMPFDEFTVEQLAGDLLPDAAAEQLLATGFLRNTLSNREGGADLEQYRVEQVVDRTQIVGVGWLGLSVGCARCHDHKYEPISQKEFYQFYAILDQADEVNRDLPLPDEPVASPEQQSEYQRRRAELIAPHQPQLDELQAKWEAKLLEVAANPELDAGWNRQWEVLGLVWGGNLGEGQLEGCLIVQTPIDLRTQSERDRLQDYFLASGSIIDETAFRELKISDLAEKLKALKKDYLWSTRAPTMRQARTLRSVYVHQRGEFRVPGEQVQPATFSFLNRNPTSSTEQNSNSHITRFELANWLMSEENPLPARVVVNRIWQEFYGQGLVDPPNDFGLRGQPPSHPELLDWLACEFRRRQWSPKSMHRVMVTSATYRQSSHARPELNERDPGNRWLARQAALRFSADQIRDVCLSVCGLLDNRVGGPSVFPPQPDSVMNEGFYQHGWKESEGPDRYRRAIYTWLARLSPFAQNVTFDAPPTNSLCTRRDRTNSPLQALTLLNDPVFFEAAQALSRRLLLETKGDFDTGVNSLFEWCLARPPQPHELAILRDYYQEQITQLADQPDTVDKLVPNVVDPARRIEQAAWTNTASVILNLHEFITRE